MLELPPKRHLLATGIQALLDLSLLASAFAAAYLLRFDFKIPPEEIRNFLTQLPLVILLQFVALTISGARSSIWRYTDLAHIKSFLYAATGAFVVIALMRLGLPVRHQAWRVPLSVNLIDMLLAFGGVYAMRVARRAEYEYKRKRRQIKDSNGNGIQKAKRAVLLIGAGRAGLLAAKEIEARGDLDLEIKGFIDDDPAKLGRVVIQGHKVLGTTRDLPRLVDRKSVV